MCNNNNQVIRGCQCESKKKSIKGVRGRELKRGWRERKKESNVVIIMLIKFSLKTKQNKK